ncbi:MAG: hypothetical protein ACOY4Q_13960 [Bacillota bacterium]
MKKLYVLLVLLLISIFALFSISCTSKDKAVTEDKDEKWKRIEAKTNEMASRNNAVNGWAAELINKGNKYDKVYAVEVQDKISKYPNRALTFSDAYLKDVYNKNGKYYTVFMTG